MALTNLELNRDLKKVPQQTAETENSVFVAINPKKSSGNPPILFGQNNKGDEDYGSKNVLTGTVITSCFIQTNGSPSRVEIAGNDIKFFDNTFNRDGAVKGDTARLVFTHDLNSDEGFIMEKRSSINDTYDNVLSWYATPAKTGRFNYLFIGRDGRASETNLNQVNLAEIAINYNTALSENDTSRGPVNGQFGVSVAQDGTYLGLIFAAGRSARFTGGISPAVSFGGWSTFLGAAGGGYIIIGDNMIPQTSGLNLGTASNKFGTFYGTTSACPLPVPNGSALEIIDRLPAPTVVGERGHYGDDILYFDNKTAPEEMLFTDNTGYKDFENGKMIGFLLKAVIELHEKVRDLQARIT